MDLQMMLSLLHTLEQLRRHERWTRPQLEAHQAEALGRLRTRVYAHSPFYEKYHKGLENRPLAELPVLTKATMMENFDALMTDRNIHLEDVRAHIAKEGDGSRYLDRYWVNATSGSTGSPGFFLFNRREWTTVLASFARSHEWAGVKISLTHRMKMASIASVSPWHMSALVAATLKSWWMQALRLAASEPLMTTVQRLNDWQPEMLVAYASMARSLAEEQIAGRLRIAPHLIYTSSEVLTDETRRRIEAAWGHPPFNQYASTEIGGMAAETTEHQGLYLYEDNAIIEVVDEHYRPVPTGHYGDKLLLTGLFNHTQPLIRYELSDSVRLAGKAGGSRLPFARLDGIQGRTEDILHLPAKAGGDVAVHPLTFHRVMDAVPASGWQVVQEADGLRILLSGAKNGAADVALVQSLTNALAGQGVAGLPIQVQHVVAIPKTKAGKAPLVMAYVTPDQPMAELG